MELTIDGIKAKLGNSKPAITKRSIDVENPSNRFIDITNRFNLPYVQQNIEIFESPKAIGSNNKSHDQLYDAVLNDVFQLFKGKGFLDSNTKDELNFQIVDKSKDLFKALEINLREISWDDNDILLTTSQIDALSAANIDNCWVWGKLCLHKNALKENTDQTTGDARCKYSRPSLNVQALLKRAVINNGYDYSSAGIDLAISCWHEDFFFTSYQKILSGDYVVSGSLALSGLDGNDFEHSDLTVAGTTINIGAKNTKFRLRGTIESTSNIDIIIKATDNIDPAKFTENKLSLVAGQQSVDFSTSEFQNDNGYTIEISFSGNGTITFNDVFLYTLLSDKNEDLSTNPFLGYKIKVYDNLPELTYKDLFHLICVVSNQYQIIDNDKKSFTWGSLANLNKNNSVDWSEKFVQGSEKVTGQFSGLYQKNWLKYENDLTVNSKLGWSFFNSDNKAFTDEGDYIKLNFGASNDVTINSNDIGHVRIYDDNSRIADQEIMIRLFSIQDTRLVFSPVDWRNLKNQYYSNWFKSLFRIRQITADFNLKKLDVLKWHPKQLVYIDYFKTVFIVLEINNFIPRELTQVKFLAYGR
jgi:hypothetical protein